MLNWGNRFNICCFLDTHNYHLSHNSFECLLAAGALAQIEAQSGSALDQLSLFYSAQNDWLFGHLAYDLKNETEALSSSKPDRIGFPDLFFFVPQFILQLNESSLTIGSTIENHQQIFDEIVNIKIIENKYLSPSAFINNRYSKEEYVETVEQLRQHILRGDCYEINLCQEFYSDNITIDPLILYKSLSEASPNPFSAFYKLHHRYL